MCYSRALCNLFWIVVHQAVVKLEEIISAAAAIISDSASDHLKITSCLLCKRQNLSNRSKQDVKVISSCIILPNNTKQWAQTSRDKPFIWKLVIVSPFKEQKVWEYFKRTDLIFQRGALPLWLCWPLLKGFFHAAGVAAGAANVFHGVITLLL